MNFKRKNLSGCFLFGCLMFVSILCVIFLFLRFFVFQKEACSLDVSTDKAKNIILSEIFFAPETFIAPLETISIQKAGMTGWLDPALYVKCTIPDNQFTNMINHQYWEMRSGSIHAHFLPTPNRWFKWWPSVENNIDCMYYKNSPFSEILVMKPINDYRELYIFTFGSRNKAETGSCFSKEIWELSK